MIFDQVQIIKQLKANYVKMIDQKWIAQQLGANFTKIIN